MAAAAKDLEIIGIVMGLRGTELALIVVAGVVLVLMSASDPEVRGSNR